MRWIRNFNKNLIRMFVENAAYTIRKTSNYKYVNSQSPLSYPLAFMRGWCSAISILAISDWKILSTYRYHWCTWTFRYHLMGQLTCYTQLIWRNLQCHLTSWNCFWNASLYTSCYIIISKFLRFSPFLPPRFFRFFSEVSYSGRHKLLTIFCI